MAAVQKMAPRRTWLAWTSWALLIAACVFVLCSLIFYSMGEPFASRAFDHSLRMQPPFADLRYLLANSECGVDLDKYYQGLVVGCDPAGRTYRFDYPPMSIWLGRLLAVRGAHTALIAVSVAVSVVIVIGLMFRGILGLTWRSRLLMLPMLISAPLLSAMERGNIDLILFLAMVLLALFLSLTGLSKQWLILVAIASFGLVFLSVSLKIYPLFGIIGLLFQSRWQRRFQASLTWDKPVIKIVVVAACIAGLVAVASYLMTVGNLIKEGGLRSHGLMALGYINSSLVSHLGFSVARLVIRALVLIKIASLACGCFLSWKHRLYAGFRSLSLPFPNSLLPGFWDISMMLLTSTWLGCYMTTINYDYRYIYIFPVFILFAAIAYSPDSSLQQRRLAQLLLTIMAILFLLPLMMVGYFPFAISMLRILEPFTEFALIPLLAGSLLSFLLAQTILQPRFRMAAPLS